ncbi:hypothetical protein DQ04_05771000 [Trypanosoma grayi]|uniref:hypothetical protein n=1 Tax=Trypanosoma grayi TaxID=71804 RepID=UPI0004F46203|nr:hypothetical protein DQ04_05771000 [Trypanosoma grayi]KEG09117.1 hypothetical protein DQ04_05771000 [Trypanosoma grayi]
MAPQIFGARYKGFRAEKAGGRGRPGGAIRTNKGFMGYFPNAPPRNPSAARLVILQLPVAQSRSQTDARECFQFRARRMRQATPTAKVARLGRKLCLNLRPFRPSSSNPGVWLQDGPG